MSSYTYYIIAVSDKGIVPKREESPAMGELEKYFLIKERVTLNPLYLINGFDEKYWLAHRPSKHPLKDEELKKIQNAFDLEKRIIKIFEWKELLGAEQTKDK